MPGDPRTYRWQDGCSLVPAVKLLALIALSTGCFYVDDINQRPSIAIVNNSSDTVFRGQTVELDASGNDPENQQIAYHWRVYACTDATDPASCDHDPLQTSLQPSVMFKVPTKRTDVDVTTASIRVDLEGADDHGATAVPSQTLVMPVGDAAPELEVRKEAHATYVVNTPVGLFAKYTDSDDLLTDLGIQWDVFSPAVGDTFTLVDTPADATDPQHLQRAKIFTPQAIGSWDVQVTITDPEGMTAIGHIPVEVTPDLPPCIAQYEPLAPLADGTPPLPISAATRFSIPQVTDDLDGFPSPGTTGFAWSLKAPGASGFADLHVAGNSVELDPATYTPGDDLELRVDITDRVSRSLTCAVDDLTCAVVAGSSCIQRLTWRVEIR